MRPETGPRPPEGAFILADRLARESTQYGQESRACRRHKLTVEVEIQPVNDDFEPVGEPFVAVTQDISNDGLGFVHTRAISHKLLCFALRENMWSSYQGKVFVLEVVRCDPVGALYSVGGRFVAKIDDPRGQPIRKEASPVVLGSRKPRRHVAPHGTTATAPSPGDATAPEQDLEKPDPFIPKSHVRFDGAERSNVRLVSSVVLAGMAGCLVLWVCASIAMMKRTSLSRDSTRRAIVSDVPATIPLEPMAAFVDQLPRPSTTGTTEAQGDDRLAPLAPQVRSAAEPTDASSLATRATPSATPRAPSEGGDHVLPLSPIEDSAANEPPRPTSTIDREEPPRPRPAMDRPLPASRVQQSGEEGSPSNAELESLYFMYADMKGWSNSKRAVQEQVKSWQQHGRGSVGLAIKFFETGEDGAKRSGRNAEEAYKSMPPAYWPYPARQ